MDLAFLNGHSKFKCSTIDCYSYEKNNDKYIIYQEMSCLTGNMCCFSANVNGIYAYLFYQ